MRPGLPTSIVLHCAVLVWAMVSFASTPPFDAPAASDAIDVELLPPSATTQQKLGDKTGKPSDAITKDTKVSPKESDGKRAGDTKTEEPPPAAAQQPMPPADKPQQQAAVPTPEAKPEQPKQPVPQEKPVVKVEPTPIPQQDKPDLVKEGEKAKVVGVGKPPEVKTPPKEVKDPPKEVKDPPKDEKALEKMLDAAKQQDSKPPEKKVDPVKLPEKSQPKTDPTRIASIDPKQASVPSQTPSQLRGQVTPINNHVETGTSSSRLPQQKSLGNPNGPNNPTLKLSQSDIEALNGMLKSQISECWTPQAGWSESGVKVTLHIYINQDGTLNGDPELGTFSGLSSPLLRPIQAGAIRAVKMCAARHPFKLPPDKYAAWAQNDITFDPSQPLQ